MDPDGQAVFSEHGEGIDDIALLVPEAADEQDVTGKVGARLRRAESLRIGRNRQQGRDLGAAGANHAHDVLTGREHEVELVEPRVFKPALRPVSNRRHGDEVPRHLADVAFVEENDDRLDPGRRRVPAAARTFEVRDAPSKRLKGVAKLVAGVPVAVPRSRIVLRDRDPDMKRLAREPLATVQRVKECVSEEAWSPRDRRTSSDFARRARGTLARSAARVADSWCHRTARPSYMSRPPAERSLRHRSMSSMP